MAPEQFISLFVLPPRLNENDYFNFIRNNVPRLLEISGDESFQYQYDGAMTNFHQLNEDHLEQCKGIGGPFTFGNKNCVATPEKFSIIAWLFRQHWVFFK